jgi:hypothetical protein
MMWNPIHALRGLFSTTAAQPADEEAPARRFHGANLMTLYDSMAYDKRRSSAWFAALGYPPPGRVQGGGGSGRFAFRRVFVEGGGFGGGTKTDDDTIMMGYGGGGGFLGITLLEIGWLRVFPLLGGNGGGAAITRINAQADAESPSEEVLHNINSGGMLIGLGADVIVPLGKMHLLIGARIGWRINMAGPEAEPGGPFVQIVAGPAFGQG